MKDMHLKSSLFTAAILSFSVSSWGESKAQSGTWQAQPSYQNIELECRQHQAQVRECRYSTISKHPLEIWLQMLPDSGLDEAFTKAEDLDISMPDDYRQYLSYRHMIGDQAHHAANELGFVRLPGMTGFWSFKALDNGLTRITYQRITVAGKQAPSDLLSISAKTDDEAGARIMAMFLQQSNPPEHYASTR